MLVQGIATVVVTLVMVVMTMVLAAVMLVAKTKNMMMVMGLVELMLEMLM